MSEPRFVLDANVIISAALLPQAPARQAFNKALQQGKILMSEAILKEIHEVLQRPKFDRYVTRSERLEFLTALTAISEKTQLTLQISACRDPKDNKYLEAAVSGKASAIISGDEDLLVLHPFQGIPIVTPRAFLELNSTNEQRPEA